MLIADKPETLAEVLKVLRLYGRRLRHRQVVHEDELEIARRLDGLTKTLVPVVVVTRGRLATTQKPGRLDYRGMTRTFSEHGTVVQIVHLPKRADEATTLHELVHAVGYGECPAYAIGDDFRAWLSQLNYYGQKEDY